METQEKRDITHLQLISWTDFGAPDQEEIGVMDFLIEKLQENIRDFPEGKIVVHCSAGIGRTGTLIAIYNIIEAIEELVSRESEENVPRVSVFGTVRRLREQRF